MYRYSFRYIDDMVSRHSGLPRGSRLSTLAGALLSGFVVAVVINPLDVVTTRLYNQPAQVKHKHLHLADCK